MRCCWDPLLCVIPWDWKEVLLCGQQQHPWETDGVGPVAQRVCELQNHTFCSRGSNDVEMGHVPYSLSSIIFRIHTSIGCLGISQLARLIASRSVGMLFFVFQVVSFCNIITFLYSPCDSWATYKYLYDFSPFEFPKIDLMPTYKDDIQSNSSFLDPRIHQLDYQEGTWPWWGVMLCRYV